MNNLLDEDPITLNEAAKLVPSDNGRRVSTTTLWRWCRRGVGPQRVRLEYIRIGRRIFTSHAAIGRFFAALAEADAPIEDPPPAPKPQRKPTGRSEAQRNRDIENAERELSAAGA